MATTSSTLSLRSILEKDMMTGTNFLDCFRNVRIVLTQEGKLYVMENPIPAQPAANAPRAQRDAYEKHVNDSVDDACLMLATMVPSTQKCWEITGAQWKRKLKLTLTHGAKTCDFPTKIH